MHYSITKKTEVSSGEKEKYSICVISIEKI